LELLNRPIDDWHLLRFLRLPYFLSVQDLERQQAQTVSIDQLDCKGDPSGFTLGNFRLGVLGNVTYPFSSLGVVDYESGIAVGTAGISPSSVGVAYGQRIMGASITTGQLLWNVSTDTSTGLNGFFSGSTAVADHGKYAVRLNDGHWHCWICVRAQNCGVASLQVGLGDL